MRRMQNPGRCLSAGVTLRSRREEENQERCLKFDPLSRKRGDKDTGNPTSRRAGINAKKIIPRVPNEMLDLPLPSAPPSAAVKLLNHRIFMRILWRSTVAQVDISRIHAHSRPFLTYPSFRPFSPLFLSTTSRASLSAFVLAHMKSARRKGI